MQRLNDWRTLSTGAGDELIAPCGPDAPVKTSEVSAALVRATPGSDPVPRHHHESSIELYLVMEGEAIVEVNGERFPVGPGATVLMERGDVHSIVPSGESDLVYWAISTPGWVPSDHILEG